MNGVVRNGPPQRQLHQLVLLIGLAPLDEIKKWDSHTLVLLYRLRRQQDQSDSAVYDTDESSIEGVSIPQQRRDPPGGGPNGHLSNGVSHS